jgi:hypothetical protein
MSDFASRFAAGSAIAGDLLDTYNTIRKRKEIADIVAAQQIGTGGAQIEGTTEAVQAQLDSGAGMGEARKLASTGTTPTEYSFLGKTSATPLDDAGQATARTQAMAGVMEKFGDTEGAMRYRQQAQQGEMNAMQLKQMTRQGVREDKADALTATMEGVDKAVGEADTARRTNPDGTVRPMTIDDHLSNGMVRASLLTKAGRVKEAGDVVKEHNSMSFAKIQLDTAQRNEDLGRAASALGNGDTTGIKDFYNKHVPDGAKVTNVTEDAKGNVTIERTTLDGQPLPTVTKNKNELLAGLNSFKDPMALYHWSQTEFQNNLALKADTRADKSLKIQAGSAAISNQLHQVQIDEHKQNLDDKKEYSGIRTELNDAIDAGDAKTIGTARSKLLNFMTSGKAALNNISPEQRKADFYLASGLAKTPAEAARMSHEKVQLSPQDFLVKLMTPNAMGMTTPIEKVEETMNYVYGPNWKDGSGASPGGKPMTQAEFDKLPSGAVYTNSKGGQSKKP